MFLCVIQVAEKMSLIEQYKMERERLQKVHTMHELKRQHDFGGDFSVVMYIMKFLQCLLVCSWRKRKK